MLTISKEFANHQGQTIQMNLRRKRRAVDQPISEVICPTNTGENPGQRGGLTDDHCTETRSDYDDETQTWVGKRFKSNIADSACFRRPPSDGKMYAFAESKTDDQDDEEKASNLSCIEGDSRKMGLDISVRLCKAVAMAAGAGSHPVDLRHPAVDKIMIPSQTPSDVHAERKEMQSVMSSILKMKNKKGDHSYKCIICGVTFRDYFDIYIHIRMHGGERSMRALVNQQKTLIENAPDSGMRLNGRPFECLICYRKFKLPKSLLAHVTNFHPSSEDTLIARVPQKLLPPGLIDNASKTDAIQKSGPLTSAGQNVDSSSHSTQQTLKAMEMLVETDSLMLPTARGSKILQPSHSLSGALAPPPPPVTLQHPVTQANRPILPPQTRVLPASDTELSRDSNTVQKKAVEIPLDLSFSQEANKRRSPGTLLVTKDGILESPNPTRVTNAYNPARHDIESYSPPAAYSTQLSAVKFTLPRQSMAIEQGRQSLPQQRVSLQSQSPGGDHLDEYYTKSSQHYSSIQDPYVSSEIQDDHEDTVDLAHNPYLQLALERQFNIELDLAERQLRRKFSNLGLCSERMEGRSDLQRIPGRELDLQLINELMRLREMHSPQFDDGLENSEQVYDHYLDNTNDDLSPSPQILQPPSSVAFSSENRIQVPSSPSGRHEIRPQASVYSKPSYPKRDGPVWCEKGAERQPPTQRSPRQPIIPHLLSLPSRFQVNPTPLAYKINPKGMTRSTIKFM